MTRTLVTIAIIIVTSTVASADDDRTRAAKLFEDGRADVQRRDYAAACPKFVESYALDKAPGTALNLGDCREHLDQARAAYQAFIEAAEGYAAAGNTVRSKFARDHADALLPKLATVTVKLATPAEAGLVVTVAGRDLPPAQEIKELVDPGMIEIRVTAPDKLPFVRSEKAEAGSTIVIDVPALGSTAKPPPPPPPNVEKTATGPRRRSRLYLSIGLGTGGGLTLAGAAWLAVTARRDYHRTISSGACDQPVGSAVACSPDGTSKIDHARKLANTATALDVAGAALVIAGAAIFITAPRELVVTPVVDGRTAGITALGRF